MKRQIRRGVYETNSSSTHSLTMCSEEEFEQWKNGELLFDEWGSESFVKANSLSNDDKKYAAQDYENHKDELSKNWSDLSESAKEKYYTKYAKENNIVDEDAKTYEEWQYGNLETFVDRYTSKSGDKIVAFGKYGYDG